jgi:cytochrome c oxidase subunit IV
VVGMPAIHATSGQHSRLRTGAALMTLAGLAFVAYAVVFLVLNFTGAFLELGIGPDQVDKGKADVEAFSPQLSHYISHLHIALSGFIAATGLALAGLSWYGVRRGERWALTTALIVSAVGLAVAVPAHYPWGFATLGHLGPVYLAVLILVVGAGAAYNGMRSPPEPADA